MSGQLPLKDTIKNTLINHSRKFPNEKIFAVCVTRLNNIEITLNVVSQPARQSSVFDYPTYYYLYDSAKQVLFLFYSGMEYIVQEKDINDIYSKIIEELSLFDDWNEKTGQEVNIGTYHEIGFQVNYTLNGNIFIEAGDPFSSCVYFPMVIKEFPIPVP
ncbi:MAG: hypothetical protein SF052_16140 [Bacteroidia bacterium]|nr:hypothetical protein [Bacteroidia bacterium]